MADIASEAGVPDHDLLVENRSASTFENARFSATLLDAHGLLDDLSTVLLVSSEWHMRRVLLTTKKYFPADIRFVCCPTCEGCNRDDWTQSDTCRMEVLNEATLLKAFLMTGAI